MKIKILKQLIFAVSLILMASCSLDENIYDSANEDNFPKDENDTRAAVDGAYNLTATAYRFGLGHSLFMMEDVWTFQSGTNAISLAIGRGDIQNSNTDIEDAWNRLYKIIAHCNLFLDKFEAGTMPAGEKWRDQFEGELRFHRALAYFNLVRLWGRVPLRKTTSTSATNVHMPRSSEEEVYAFILEDLEKAEKVLWNVNDNRFTVSSGSNIVNQAGRVTKGAAVGLKAQVYLTMGEYEKTIAHCDSILKGDYAGKYTFNTAGGYTALFDPANEATLYREEILFGVRYSRDRIAKVGQPWGRRTCPAQKGLVGTSTHVGYGWLRIQQYIYEMYTTEDYGMGHYEQSAYNQNDPRFGENVVWTWYYYVNTQGLKAYRYTWAYPNFGQIGPQGSIVNVQTANENNPYLVKWKDELAYEGDHLEGDYYLLRLSDIYLMKAEAINELYGPTAEAYNCINTVRARARTDKGAVRIYPLNVNPESISTQADFRWTLFCEYGIEFFGEMKRYFDMKRMKSPDGTQTMFEYMYTDWLLNNREYQNMIDKTYFKGTGNQYHDVSDFLLWPIPQSELMNNAALANDQNPGY